VAAVTLLSVTVHAPVEDRPPTGEQVQAQGDDGVQRAKLWLESTCRAEVRWYQPHNQVKQIQFLKMGAAIDSVAKAAFFSFDLGGLLCGGDDDGAAFVAEVKNYHQDDQGEQYRQFLANAYCTEMRTHGARFDHYMWITWNPFLSTKWAELLTENFIESAIVSTDKCREAALGTATAEPSVVGALAKKLMIVVLGDRQEQTLRLQGAELIRVRQALIEIRQQ
jgi:hypothetical protein